MVFIFGFVHSKMVKMSRNKPSKRSLKIIFFPNFVLHLNMHIDNTSV